MWIISQIALLILYVPWLLTQSPSGTSLNTVPAFNAELSRNLWRGYILPVIADPDDLPRSFIALSHVLPILFGLSLVILLIRGRSRRAGLVASQAILLPILSTFMLIAASIDFHPRYYILAIPATLLMIPLAIATFPQKTRFALAAGTIIIVAFITGRTFSLIVDNPEYQHDDFRAMADYYATLPDDTLILIPYDDEPTFTNYYARQVHLDNEIITSFLSQTLSDRDSARVELLTWFQVPADRSGLNSCRLGASTDQPPEVFQVKGLTTTGYLMTHPVNDYELIEYTEIEFADPLSLSTVRLEDRKILYRVSEYGFCLSVLFAEGFIERQFPTELKVAARLLDSLGWEIVQSDSLILYELADGSENWQKGWAENFLPLPEGIPPGEYDVLLRLYSPENTSGFDVIDRETGQSLGKDLRISIYIPGNPYDNPPENPAVLRDNTEDGDIRSGLRLELELQNSFSEEIPLILEGDDWRVEETIPAGPSLAWTALQIPPDAEGQARLTFGENELAVYNIIKVERTFRPPPVALEMDTAFGGRLLELYGATIQQTEDEIHVELVWHSLSRPFDDHVVFVQLLDENGALLAQNDQMPEHATSNWMPNEYITDSHSINLDGLNYEGQATIIVGMYHPVTRARVTVTNGEDFVRLPTEVIFE